MRAMRRTALICAVAVLSACAAVVPGANQTDISGLALELPRHRLVLLGEVHDNLHHHRLRHAALKTALEANPRYRPALLMEQFDRERQDDIERARRERPRDAAYLVTQASPQPTRPGGAGWNWDFYRPFVQLALDYDLPLIAANVSRADLMRLASGGFKAVFTPAQLATLKLDQPVPATLQSTLEQDIHTGHCNALPAAALAPMARGQMARDAFMAWQLSQHAARGAVLLAGNGHVRKQVAAPFWLARMGSAEQAYVAGFGETGGADAAANYDRLIVTAAVARPHPCEAFLKSRHAPKAP